MYMKKLVIILLAGTLFPFCVNAQLGKQMSKYHEKAGVTVTQLDKNLYGLYQRENLTPEINATKTGRSQYPEFRC